LGLAFRKTLFRGEESPFVMELPPYRLPTVRGVASHMWQKSASYVRKAGTFILAASVILWASLSFPKTRTFAHDYEGQASALSLKAQDGLARQNLSPAERDSIIAERDSGLAALDHQLRTEQAEASLAGRLGHAVQPVMKYAGFDWKINVALISGIAAKEVIISTLGIVYGLGDVEAPKEAADAAQSPLTSSIRSDPTFTPVSALALMVFVMIYIPCIATLAVTRKELGSIKWPAFVAGYTLVVAYLLAVLVNQVGRLIL
jgi:ferrous iron transport protein B